MANCFEQQEEYSVVRLGKYLRERYWVEKREGESIEDYAERSFTVLVSCFSIPSMIIMVS